MTTPELVRTLVPDAPPQEPSDRSADIDQRLQDLKKDIRTKAQAVDALERRLRTGYLPPVDGAFAFDAQQERVARLAAEGEFCVAAEAYGWQPTKTGAPDYFCLAENGTIALVAVLPKRTSRLRREQLRVMTALAACGVPCFRWSPDAGFERFRGGSMTVLEFLRRTRRMSQANLGEAAGIPQDVVSGYERGVRPTPDHLQRLADVLLVPGRDPSGLLREVPSSVAMDLLPARQSRTVVP